jgi:hypothetical protein
MCLFLAVITHAKLEIVAGNYGSSFRMIMTCAALNALIILPEDRSACICATITHKKKLCA